MIHARKIFNIFIDILIYVKVLKNTLNSIFVLMLGRNS